MRKSDWIASWVSSGRCVGDDCATVVRGFDALAESGNSSTLRKVGRLGKISASFRGIESGEIADFSSLGGSGGVSGSVRSDKLSTVFSVG